MLSASSLSRPPSADLPNPPKVSFVSLANTVQCYTTTHFTKQVYLGPKPSPSNPLRTPTDSLSPSTPLSSRTFGTWTLITAIIRFYAAYHISNPQIYELAFATYLVAGFHFYSEWLWFGTARWGKGIVGPAVVSTCTVAWMWSVWGSYVVV